MDTNSKTLEELKQLRREWYENARNEGKFGKLSQIARVLGVRVPHNYGPKWEFIDGDTRIYVDDYGNYMTVRIGNRLVCSTHNEAIYIPDVCDEIIVKGYPVVEQIMAEKKAEDERLQASKLQKELFG